MKSILLLSFLFASAVSFAQEKVVTSNSFNIEGKVKQKTSFTARNADTMAAADLGEITTLNHRGEVRSVRKGVKGILLRDVLKNLLPDADKPKELGSYYFILVGADGYRFVLSYNEVFGSESVYIITSTNGDGFEKIADRVAVLVLMKPHQGHVAMKGLARILVQKA